MKLYAIKNSLATLTLRSVACGCALTACVASTIAAAAGDPPYPSKPIRLLVGSIPGGTTDTAARIMAQPLTQRLGQQVVVDDRGSANGNAAAETAARAAPDGYTLLVASASHAINASLYSHLSYDPVKDFTPLTLITSSPFILVTQPALGVTSVKDVIATAKAKPGIYTYAAGGASSHLAGELFKSMAGVNIVYVPYKGSGPAMTDLLGGQVTMMLSAPPAALPHVATGRLRALGVTGAKRLASAPDVPTIAEAGLPGFEVDSWNAVLMPAKAPKNIVSKLHDEIAYVMALPEVKARMPALGMEAKTNTPEQFTAYLVADIKKWSKVVDAAGIKLE